VPLDSAGRRRARSHPAETRSPGWRHRRTREAPPSSRTFSGNRARARLRVRTSSSPRAGDSAPTRDGRQAAVSYPRGQPPVKVSCESTRNVLYRRYCSVTSRYPPADRGEPLHPELRGGWRRDGPAISAGHPLPSIHDGGAGRPSRPGSTREHGLLLRAVVTHGSPTSSRRWSPDRHSIGLRRGAAGSEGALPPDVERSANIRGRTVYRGGYGVSEGQRVVENG